MRYLLELSFNGANYHGWQIQPNSVSIQETIRDQILSMTGNHARSIDVIIDDIKMDSPEKSETDDQWASDSTS